MFAPLLLLRVHTTHVFCCIGEQCHMSRLFKSYTQTALMLGACPCLPAGFDFATIGDVAFQETVSIFVINFAYMIVAKLTNFAARCALSFFFQAEDGIRDLIVTGVQTCALPI